MTSRTWTFIAVVALGTAGLLLFLRKPADRRSHDLPGMGPVEPSGGAPPTAPSVPPVAPTSAPARGEGEAAAPPRAGGVGGGGPARPLDGVLSGTHPGGAPPGDPSVVSRALAERSPDELRLMGTLDRANLASPPELGELFALKGRGATPAELRAFVRTRFPEDVRLRLAISRWINASDPSRPQPSLALPSHGGVAPLGGVDAPLGAGKR